MTTKYFKWANQLHWQIKGHLIPKEWCHDEKQVREMEKSYFNRLWGNHEAGYRLAGFDAAWKTRYGT